MTKGIIYYTDNRIDNEISWIVQRSISSVNLPIVSASLKPIPFGENMVIECKRSYPTMVRQIVSCLERSYVDVVYFCEHDVLYHASHFTFNPPRNDTFYYNVNTWRWEYPKDRLIRYDGMISLSGLCVGKQLALDHFQRRSRAIQGLIATDLSSKDPSIFRKWGFEPGTKRMSNGGFSDEKMDTWSSRHPNIDIRHDKTYSPPKTHLEGFKHKPKGWKESKLNDIDGFNLREMFL